MKWLDNKGQCRSCGRPLLVLAIACSSGVLFLLFWGVDTFSSHGVQIDQASCQPMHTAYEATTIVRNTETDYKAITVALQGRFQPSAGSAWPSQALRDRFEQTTQFASVLVEPNGKAEATTQFAIPGGGQYACTAKASLARLERFSGRPSDEALAALKSHAPTTGGMRGGFMRRRIW